MVGIHRGYFELVDATYFVKEIELFHEENGKNDQNEEREDACPEGNVLELLVMEDTRVNLHDGYALEAAQKLLKIPFLLLGHFFVCFWFKLGKFRA